MAATTVIKQQRSATRFATSVDAPPSAEAVNDAVFERGSTWMSSFHGDRYLQEDFYKISNHVKVDFDDIFSEPDALRASDIGQFLSPPVRHVFSLVFVYTQGAIYYFLTILTGVFIGLAWGVVFGLISFALVWLIQPIVKVFFILLRVCSLPVRASVRAILDPFFQAIGQVFCFISAKLRLRITGPDDRKVNLGFIRKHGKLGEEYNEERPMFDPREWFGFV